MEQFGQELKHEKQKWEVNFDNELEELSKKVRPQVLQNEFVKPLKVKNISPILAVAESVFQVKEKGLDFTSLLVGPDTAMTQDHVMQGMPVESDFCASFTDGRIIRLDFKGSTKVVPQIKITEDGKTKSVEVARPEISGIEVEGYAIKGSGASFGYDELETQRRIVSGGVAGRKEQFGAYRHQSILRGEGELNELTEEKDYLLKYLSLGARVDIPILTAELDEPKARKTSGILILAYRTPFNFQHFLRTPNRNFTQAKYLIMHGISIWKREGLINNGELASLFLAQPTDRNQRLEQTDRLIKFYIENGSRIAGDDLAKIHTETHLDNRNPQNMGNDFSHRDVSDFHKPHIFDKLLPSGKYEDIHGDLKLIRNVMNKLKPDSAKELLDIAVEEYLKSYFSCGLGMSPKEFGLNLLKDVIKNAGLFLDETQTTMIKKFRKLAIDGFFKDIGQNT